MYVTPRTLLAIIRLAQAMAKLNFRNEVKQFDVDEALTLMDFSIKSLRNLKGDNKNKRKNGKIWFMVILLFLERDSTKNDKMSQIINAVREVMQEA